MERDKRGRFVKKAQLGSEITYNGKQYRLKKGITMQPDVSALMAANLGNTTIYEQYLNNYYEPVDNTPTGNNSTTVSSQIPTPNTPPASEVTPEISSTGANPFTTTFSLNDVTKPEGFYAIPKIPDLKLNAGLKINATNTGFLGGNNGTLLGNSNPIKYGYKDGQIIDEFGASLSPLTIDYSKYVYSPELTNSLTGTDVKTNAFTGMQVVSKPSTGNSDVNDVSAGFKPVVSPSNGKGKNGFNWMGLLNKTKLADFLDWTRAGMGIAANNKIAERALEAEKPFLQDVSESHRSVYGDYRAQVQGEKAAAQLRNMASKPITSDGALQQQMMLEAQIKGQEYIDKGNAQDEALIKQTRETAWQQEKENTQQRQAVAMSNRQAMLMSQKNKAQIENARDSANFSQVITPLLGGQEQRLRNKGKEQEYYQDYYNDAMVAKQVWGNYTDGLSENQKEMARIYLTEGTTGLNKYIGEGDSRDVAKYNEWLRLNQIMQNEIIRRKAELKGVYVDVPTNNTINDPFAVFRGSPWSYKKGGTIYKAKLTKRTKDNDRGAKSIESSKKIAARFLEKALDSLYSYNDVELVATAKKSKRKYQAGGGLPFVSHTPVFATSETGTPSTAAKETKGEDITTKDILELLKDIDGLPSDIDAIQAALSNFILADQMDPLGLDSSSNIAARYMKVIGQIKKAKANRDWYDKAYDKLRSDGALNEYAIDSTGHFIGMNSEGDFARFNAKQVAAKQTGEYTLLTNSNLLDIRARYPNAAFNSNLIMEAANGVSMNQVVEHINKVIQGLGSDKNQTQVFGNQSKEVLAGLRQLQQAAQQVGQDLSISELYEANVFTESQAQQAQLALSYLYQTLPTNMQALLFSKTGSAEGARDLINSLVNSKLSSTTKLEFSPKNTRKATTSSKTGNVVLAGLDLSPAQMLQQGFGERETITIQDATSTGLQVEAITMPITKEGNKPMGSATLEDISTSQYGGVLNFTNASMGGQLIPFEGRRNIAVDGSKIYSMYLPIDQNELMKGNIMPDLSLIDKVNTVNKQIKDKQITDPNEINKMYVQAGLPVFMNSDKTVVPTFYRRFGVINGTAIDNAFGSNFVANKYLKEVDDENTINSAIAIMNQGRNKEDRIEYDAKSFFNLGGLLGDYDTIYQGTIFIPISNDVFAGIAGSGNTITSTEANALEAKQQQHQRVSATYRNPGQLR